MKKSRYTDSQIINILKAAEGGTPVVALFFPISKTSANVNQGIVVPMPKRSVMKTTANSKNRIITGP